jgi:ABC-type transport system substrate-binding protein
MNDEDSAQKWKPASIEEVKEILQENLAACDREQRAAFDRDAVEPYFANIVRYGKLESVIVVARRNNEVIYWEDVECGFNVSPVDENGTILEHWCNQAELGYALNRWVNGRSLPGGFVSARPIS